jgi:hypothetical protein
MGEVIVAPRRELLTTLALMELSRPEGDVGRPTHIPLSEGEWEGGWDNAWLAAKEAAAIGEIEMSVITGESDSELARHLAAWAGGRDAAVRITEKGLATVERMGWLSDEDRAAARRMAMRVVPTPTPEAHDGDE